MACIQLFICVLISLCNISHVSYHIHHFSWGIYVNKMGVSLFAQSSDWLSACVWVCVCVCVCVRTHLCVCVFVCDISWANQEYCG